MKIKEFNEPVQPDTYEASMALNQIMKIGRHAIKLHKLIDDSAEMEAWVQKKIDLAGDYVKKVHGYMQGQDSGLYDDDGLTENVDDPVAIDGKVVKKFATDNPDTKFILSKTSNGKFKVTYNMDVNIGGVAKTGAQTQTVRGETNEFDNANDAIAAGKKDAADTYKDELVKSKQPRQPDPPFNVEDWSTDKVQEFGGDLIKLAKGQPIEMPGYDSYGMELDDGRPSNDEEGNEAANDSIGGEVTSAIRMHRGNIEDNYDSMVDYDKVKPNRETIEYAQAIIKSPEFKKAYQRTESLEARLEAKLSENAGDMDALKKWLIKYSKYRGMNGDKLPFGLYMQMAQTGVPTDGMEAGEARQAIADQNPSLDPTDADAMAGAAEEIPGVNFDKADAPITNAMKSELADIMGVDAIGEEEITKAMKMLGLVKESVSEDAGEGHMSKSTLYHTAKYAIELASMIKPGDDLEGWVQSKLNKAADYLQGAYNYEEYQKLNPYREELDSNTLSKHAQVIQKHIDEILARETSLDDIDTKPGMMRILNKRVNEVEKELAKENRKEVEEGGMPASIIKHKEKLAHMSDEELANRFKDFDEQRLRQMAWRHGYGKMSSHYLDRVKNHMTSKRTGTTEAELEEGLKDWAKRLAAAGIIVGAVAGMGSIQNALDNSVPAVKAMNTAYELAVDQGHTELAKNIEDDLSAVKVRLQSGKDLNFVKNMQDKYSKFVDSGGLPSSIDTEGLAYESKLAIMLNQQT